jgi:hypothetical protein
MLIKQVSLTKSGKIRKGFQRREDLTETIRMNIAVTAYLAQQRSEWGVITGIARQYGVSRPFVYYTLFKMQESLFMTFGTDSYADKTIEVQDALKHILSLKLEGMCSIGGISTCMKRFGLKNSSEGFISQYLADVGSQLPSTFSNQEESVKLAVFASDEIFSKNTPILVTVDPVSSVILRIELSETRKAKDWVNHWQCIEDNGHSAIYLVSDEGTGLTAGHARGLADRPFQPDTYHVIAHRLGIWLKRLEKNAYKAMDKEYECLRVFDSAKSDAVIRQRIENYESAVQKTLQSIKLYEDFNYLYSSLVKELHLFDSNGNFRNRKFSEENMAIILNLFDTLSVDKISETVAKIRKTLPDLFNYFDHAATTIQDLEQSGFDKEALKALCLAWQWHKSVMKSKKAPRRRYCRENEMFCIDIATGYLQEECDAAKEQVYRELNCVVQSSAMVECINSILRPYLNTSRNQITQETLNLIMFYHNHRRYKSGERAGKTPCEILTGKKQEKDWMELLFEAIDGNVPIFNDFSQKQPARAKVEELLRCHGGSDDYPIAIKSTR